MLGIVFDGKLSMGECICDVAAECRWKCSQLLKCKRYYNTGKLVNLFKSQILGFIEYRTAGVYHACSSHLQKIDKVLSNFLGELGIDFSTALHDYGLAPLESRRDIAMLGVIHRAVLNEGPPQLRKYFVRDHSIARHNTRVSERRHSRALTSLRKGHFLEIVRRSILGLVDVYNLLPQWVVEMTS